QNMRAGPDELSFANWLLSIGEGRANDSNGNVKIPEECLVEGNLEDVILCFDDIDSDTTWKRVILCSTNEHVSVINDTLIRRFPGSLVISTSIDQLICDDGEDPTEFPTEYLNAQTPSG